jgi:hypothetical protein
MDSKIMTEFEMVGRMEMTRLKEPVMVESLELKTLKASSTADLMAALILMDAEKVVSSGWLTNLAVMRVVRMAQRYQ